MDDADRAFKRERAAHEVTRRRLAQEKAAHRRTSEELQWAWEKCRVLERVIQRLADKN